MREIENCSVAVAFAVADSLLILSFHQMLIATAIVPFNAHIFMPISIKSLSNIILPEQNAIAVWSSLLILLLSAPMMMWLQTHIDPTFPCSIFTSLWIVKRPYGCCRHVANFFFFLSFRLFMYTPKVKYTPFNRPSKWKARSKCNYNCYESQQKHDGTNEYIYISNKRIRFLLLSLLFATYVFNQ